ncbi:MAG: glutathione S-transferase family protein [bacterium]|nr:glutathione S-transferase family protein [bacterium]
MSAKLKLNELTGSPNNVKVRIALGYKGLDYDREPFALDDFPGNRSAIAKLSRQPRLPVLEHGETTVFDSAGIVRYLEANFPDTPRLFVDGYQGHAEIEQWELFAKTQISGPIGTLFTQAFAPQPDTAEIATANKQLNERLGVLEDKLSSGDYLVGDHLTQADIAVAAPLYLADMTEKNAESNPIAAFFHKNLTLGDGREKTRAWIRRVMAYDAVLGSR